jgi:endoglucanase
MLTLAAMHVLNDTTDPYFTSLQSGEYEKRRPQGRPCDAVFSCAPGLSKVAKIVLAVVLSTVGTFFVALAIWWWLLFIKRGKGV